MGRGSSTCIGVALCVGVSSALAAQEASDAKVTLVAGSATDALGLRANAVTVAPSLVLRPSPEVGIELGLHGTRFMNRQWAAGGSAAIGIRAPIAGALALTLDASGAATSTSYRARFASVDAVPALEVQAGPLVAFAGGRFGHGRTVLPAASPAGPLDPRGQPASLRTANTLRGAVAGGAIRGEASGARGSLAYRQEHSAVADTRYVERIASVSVSRGRFSVSGSAGARAGESASEAFGSVASAYSVSRRTALHLAAGRYPTDHLAGTVGGSFLSVGVVITATTTRPPAPRRTTTRIAGLPAPAPGTTRVVIHAPAARRVEVAADWTGWRPVAARRTADGHWYADFHLAKGRYRYAFRLDGSRWAVPQGTDAVDDGFGGKSAWLTVP